MRYLVLLLLMFCLTVAPAQAVTMRYAIVVGNNTGLDRDGQEPFAPLRHAEQEATQLQERLGRLCNFSSERSILLLGTTRAQLFQAVSHIEKQMERDRAILGKVDTLFGLFFTGHGLQGELLLNDGPVSAADIGRIYKQIGADFNIGLIDACYSGSLDLDELSRKGFLATPGVNPFRELPEEVLTSKGSVWFVSSGPGQVSYEDSELGGVFTHFFIEALEGAHRDGPGITLERIWHYTRENTVEYTAARQRRQVPQQFVAKLKTQGPLYFSFPGERTATLVFGPSLEGTFVLSYAGGQLTEMFDKKAGQEQEFAVYPGNAWLMVLKQGQVQIQERVELKDGQHLVLHTNLEPPSQSQLLASRQQLWEKGLGKNAVSATVVQPRELQMALYASLAGLVDPGSHSSWESAVTVGPRFGFAGLEAKLTLGYAYGRQDSYADWGFASYRGILGAGLGYGYQLGPAVLHGGLELTAGPLLKGYNNGVNRTRFYGRSGVLVGCRFAVAESLWAELFLGAGAAVRPVYQDEEGYDYPTPYVTGGVSVSYGLF